MKTHWFNTRAACAAPLALTLALALTFSLSQALFTTCGGGIAGCDALRGERVRQLARLDSRPLLATAFAPPAAGQPADTAGRAASAARREAALKAVTTRFERRFVWTFFAGMSALLSLAGLAVAVGLARMAPRVGPLRAGGRMLLVLLPPVAVGLLMSSSPERHLSIIYPLLQATIAAEPGLGMRALPSVMNVLNALSTASALGFAIACWLLVQPPPAHAPSSVPVVPTVELAARLDGLRTTATFLRVVLYVATAALVVGVLRLSATLGWLEAFLTPGDAAIFGGLRSTTTTMVGAYYSLLLAALYLPSAFIVSERARYAIASAPVPDSAKVEAYARPELSVAVTHALPRVAVLLGPVLAGPVGEFLQAVAG